MIEILPHTIFLIHSPSVDTRIQFFCTTGHAFSLVFSLMDLLENFLGRASEVILLNSKVYCLNSAKYCQNSSSNIRICQHLVLSTFS